MVIVGSVKKFLIMSSSYNINTATVVPVIVNLESLLVDSDPEEDLEEIQHEVVAEQARIEEAAQEKIAVAPKRIEKKQQEWKVEEAWKAEEKWKVEEARKAEEIWKVEETQEVEETWKEEEDKVVR